MYIFTYIYGAAEHKKTHKNTRCGILDKIIGFFSCRNQPKYGKIKDVRVAQNDSAIDISDFDSESSDLEIIPKNNHQTGWKKSLLAALMIGFVCVVSKNIYDKTRYVATIEDPMDILSCHTAFTAHLMQPNTEYLNIITSDICKPISIKLTSLTEAIIDNFHQVILYNQNAQHKRNLQSIANVNDVEYIYVPSTNYGKELLKDESVQAQFQSLEDKIPALVTEIITTKATQYVQQQMINVSQFPPDLTLDEIITLTQIGFTYLTDMVNVLQTLMDALSFAQMDFISKAKPQEVWQGKKFFEANASAGIDYVMKTFLSMSKYDQYVYPRPL